MCYPIIPLMKDLEIKHCQSSDSLRLQVFEADIKIRNLEVTVSKNRQLETELKGQQVKNDSAESCWKEDQNVDKSEIIENLETKTWKSGILFLKNTCNFEYNNKIIDKNS